MKNYLFAFFILALFLGCSKSSLKDASAETNNIKQNNTETDVMADTNKPAQKIDVAIIKTNMGTIELQLFPDKAPLAVENFTKLANKGYYDGVIFHRVIDNFMIQGGDPTGTGRGGESIWGHPFNDEFVSTLVFDKPGILAMANAGPNTNGSQFFITLAPTPWLNGHHTIFGQVIKGMDIVQAIGKVQTTKPYDKPVKDVVMEKVTVEKR